MDDVPERKKKHKSEPVETKEPTSPAEDGDAGKSVLENEALEKAENEEVSLEVGDKKDEIKENDGDALGMH